MTRRPRSITLQLALGLSLMTGLLWLGAAAISAAVMQHAVNEAYDYALTQSADRLLPLAIHDLREPYERRPPVAGLDEDEGNFAYVVRDGSGAVVLNNENAPLAAVAEAGANGFFETSAGRAFARTDRLSGFGIVVFEDKHERSDALWEAVWGLLLPLAALLPLVALGVFVALRLALRPVEALRRDLAERGRHNLAPIDLQNHPPELAPIAAEVASLLERLRQALDAERAFAASSAHELRTPIAGALAQTQVLASQLREHPAGPRTAEIERALRKLSALAERLLQFSRLEAGFARSDRVTDLMPVVRLIVRDFATAGEDVVLNAPEDARLAARLDADAFALALRNLIDNGLRHGAAAGTVTVAVGPGNGLSVTSDGPVVAADVLGALGRPFVRGESKAAGSGIGLSIVRSVMEQVGGTLALASPAPGRLDGFAARLDFSSD